MVTHSLSNKLAISFFLTGILAAVFMFLFFYFFFIRRWRGGGHGLIEVCNPNLVFEDAENYRII